jgi:transposase
MALIFPKLNYVVKDRLLKLLRRCRSKAVYNHILIVLNLSAERKARQVAASLHVHNTTVYRVAKRYREHGVWGLFDGREDNGDTKLDEHFLDVLYRLVRSSPQEHGWRRPTWTRELLVATLERQLGVRIHVATMSRALALIHARRGRPRPTVRCPWSPVAKGKRLAAIRRLLGTLPRHEAAFYEDEVDIHLNPKIGLDWMVEGQQKEVVTPGQNVKRYLAGALDVRTGILTWVEGERKASALFIALLSKLRAFNPKATVIHVILDNYRIHSSQIVQAALMGFGERIQLHFLPPYCPNDNRIERYWEDLHANVTRNHQCASMDQLMAEVREYLGRRNQRQAMLNYQQAA